MNWTFPWPPGTQPKSTGHLRTSIRPYGTQSDSASHMYDGKLHRQNTINLPINTNILQHRCVIGTGHAEITCLLNFNVFNPEIRMFSLTRQYQVDKYISNVWDYSLLFYLTQF
jgi:hypothetical protein